METIYSRLNTYAQQWWYHRQLREQGNIRLARKFERESIKLHAQVYRTSLYCYFTNGGSTIYYKSPDGGIASLQGYQTSIECCDISNCIQLGIITFDLRNCDPLDVIKEPICGSLKEKLDFFYHLKGARAYNYVPSDTSIHSRHLPSSQSLHKGVK
jgi:hypothetical protein